MKTSILLGIAGLSGALAVVLGALGAHALTEHLSPQALASFKTGVLYHLLHSLLMVALAGLGTLLSSKQIKTLFYQLVLGILFFSFSIYLLATKSIHGMPVSFLGPITPIGGIILISAWLHLFLIGIRHK